MGKVSLTGKYNIKKYVLITEMSLSKPNIYMVCGKQLSTPLNLRRHASLHLEPSSHCIVCQKGFHSHDTHRRIHTRETPYVCPTCGDLSRQCIIFGATNQVYKGVKRISNVASVKLFFCRKVTLEAHLLEHSGASKYSCEKRYKM